MAKKKPTPTAGSNLKLFYVIFGLVALFGLGGIVWTVLGQRTGGAATAPVPIAAAEVYEKARGMSIGSDDAPVRLVVFSDFMCPYCGQFAGLVEPLLEDEYIETGKLQLMYYDFPLSNHRHSFLAARAARCAGEQNRFWEYHDRLFGAQSRWASRDNPLGDFVAYGAELGLDRAAFESCVRSDRYADIVTANLRLGEELGVNATPWVIVNTKRVRNPLNPRDLKQAIDEELGL